MVLKLNNNKVLKFVAHSKVALKIAIEYGWLPGARYTNLRDIREFDQIGFIDIDWKDYNYKEHLKAVKITKPLFTVAQDVLHIEELDKILDQANELSLYAKCVIIVPKDIKMTGQLEELIPQKFVFGYSVPTKYGGTRIQTSEFKRQVHLLGGRPDVQKKLAEFMDVISIDCNRFTLDATYGDYFNGVKFVKHPTGGYEQCLRDSICNINKLWDNLV